MYDKASPLHKMRFLSTPKTDGELALYTALNKLGYNCYHMAECSLDAANDSLLLWRQAIEAKYHGKGRMFEGKDFDQMLWRYDVSKPELISPTIIDRATAK